VKKVERYFFYDEVVTSPTGRPVDGKRMASRFTDKAVAKATAEEHRAADRGVSVRRRGDYLEGGMYQALGAFDSIGMIRVSRYEPEKTCEMAWRAFDAATESVRAELVETMKALQKAFEALIEAVPADVLEKKLLDGTNMQVMEMVEDWAGWDGPKYRAVIEAAEAALVHWKRLDEMFPPQPAPKCVRVDSEAE